MAARPALQRSDGGRVVRSPGEIRPGFQRSKRFVVHAGEGRRHGGSPGGTGAGAEFALLALGCYKLAASNLTQLTEQRGCSLAAKKLLKGTHQWHGSRNAVSARYFAIAGGSST